MANQGEELRVARQALMDLGKRIDLTRASLADVDELLHLVDRQLTILRGEHEGLGPAAAFTLYRLLLERIRERLIAFLSRSVLTHQAVDGHIVQLDDQAWQTFADLAMQAITDLRMVKLAVSVQGGTEPH